MLVHNKEETLNVDDIIAKVEGQQIDVDQVSELTDAAKIKKVWFILVPDINEFGQILHLFTCMCTSFYPALQSCTNGGKVWESVGCCCVQDGHKRCCVVVGLQANVYLFNS